MAPPVRQRPAPASLGLVTAIERELDTRDRLHADAELDIDPTLSLAEAHRIAHEAEHTLTHAVPKLSSALVHAYPATTATSRDAAAQ